MTDDQLPADPTSPAKQTADNELVYAAWYLLDHTRYANNLGILVQLDDSRLEIRATKRMRWLLLTLIGVSMCVLGLVAVMLEYQSFWHTLGGIALLLLIPIIGLLFVDVDNRR